MNEQDAVVESRVVVVPVDGSVRVTSAVAVQVIFTDWVVLYVDRAVFRSASRSWAVSV